MPLTLELGALLGAALLLLALPLIYGAGMAQRVGGATLLGNRDRFPEITGWPARGKRAHQNLIENLLPFAIVVLAAHQLGISDGWTRAGALLFLAARLVHAGSYLAGFGAPRAAGFFLGTLGTLMVASQLV